MGMSRLFTGRDYVAAQRVRSYAMQMWDALFQEYQLDAIVTPSTAARAPIIEADVVEAGESNLPVTTLIMRYAFVANLVGMPAITVPIYSQDEVNAPVGLQLMGEHYREDVVLRLANAVEDIQLQKYAKKMPKPAAYYDIIQSAKANAKAKGK